MMVLRNLLLPILLLPGCAGCEETRLTETVPLLTPSSELVEFAPRYLGNQEERTITLHSTGTRAVNITGVRVEGSADFQVDPVDRMELAPNTATTLRVLHVPSTVGSAQGRVLVDNDSQNAAPLALELRGEGLRPLECDDANACTDDHFDAVGGACVNLHNALPCDDHSVCTEDDRCVEGACRGTAITCTDGVRCTRDLCERSTGCFFLIDPLACDDGNPCTADSCSAVTGCSHELLADGTRCDDGQGCTVGDFCVQGVCTSTRPPTQPALVGYGNTYGSERGLAAVLPDGRVLLSDNSERGLSQPQLSVVRVAGETVEQQALTILPDPAFVRGLLPLEGGLVAALTDDEAAGIKLVLLEVAADGTVAVHGSAVLTGTVGFLTASGRYMATHQGFIFTATSDGLFIHDVADPANLVQVGLYPGMYAMPIINSAHNVLYAYATNGPVLILDISNPTQPVAVDVPEFLPGFGLVTSGDLLATPYSGLPSAAVRLYRLPDHALLAEIRVEDTLLYPMAIIGNALLSTSAATLQDPAGESGTKLWLHDVTDPSAPVFMASQEINRLRAPWAVGEGILFASPSFFRILPGETVPFVAARSRHTGGMQTLVPREQGVMALAHTGARMWDLTNAQQPMVSASTSLPRSGSITFIGLGPGGGAPTFPLVPGDSSCLDPNELFNEIGGLWVDASNLAALGFPAAVDFPQQLSWARADGSHLYAVVAGAPDIALEVYNLSLPPSSPAVVPLGAVTLPPIGLPSVFIGCLGVDPQRHHVVVGIPAQQGSEPVASLISVVDATDAQAPVVVASTMLGVWAQSVASANGRVAVLTNTVAQGTGGCFVATELRMLELMPGGTLTESSVTIVPPSRHILAFDGVTVLLSTGTGVTFVDVTQPPPVILGHVATPQRILSAVFHDDKLVLGSVTGLAVLDPPCPPL